MNFTSQDIDILARTIYGEARGETREGKIAVAQGILNRATQGGWWGDTIERVCKHPFQFSAWNEDDPNREKMEQLSGDNQVFQTCLSVTAGVLGGVYNDPTGGANHYHTKKVKPRWALTEPIADIGNHLFYSL